MKLFITGAESFIGKRLLQFCRETDFEVTGIDSSVSADSRITQADIRDPAISSLIPEGATVVHLAAISRDPDCRKNPNLAFDVNVNGTINLALAAQSRECRQFVFASSEWVYGDVDNHHVQREDDVIDIAKMTSEYAITKLVGEQILRLVGYFEAVTILRFGIVYGPRTTNWSAVEALFNTVRSEDLVAVGSLATGRRFVHVDDIVSGILKSVGRAGYEIFNLSGDQIVTLESVIRESALLLGRNPRVEEKNQHSVSIRNPDNSKAKSELGWRPGIDLNSGLASLL